MTRVVIAEDSTVTLEYLKALVAENAALSVIGTARDGQEALEQVERLRPDVVLMDINMPRLDGLAATRLIMERAPTPIVLVSATLRADEAQLSIEALKAGALTVLGKPPGPGEAGQPEAASELRRTLKLMSEVPVVRRSPRRAPVPPRASDVRRAPAGRVRLIAIGASTGGPAAVAEVLEGADPETTPPVVVVQHMTPGFIGGFVEWLARRVRVGVKLGEPGERMQRGTVYVAPDGHEMSVTDHGRIQLDPCGAAGGVQPTVDHLFDAACGAYGRQVLAILLTGMGRDGASGLTRLRRLGAFTVAQDEDTSVVFGMPGEAIRLGGAEQVLPPAEIAGLIRALADDPRQGS